MVRMSLQNSEPPVELFEKKNSGEIMREDPIVQETRAAREELVAEFNGDLDELWAHLQVVQARYRDRVVTGRPKPPTTPHRKVE